MPFEEEEFSEPVEDPIKVEDTKEVWIVPAGYVGMIGESTGEEEFEGDSVISRDSLNVILDADYATKTPQGYLKFDGIVIAKELVQDYDGKKVYKPAEELSRILDHGENRHVTDEHPESGIVTSIKERKGFIDNLLFTDSNELKADVTITCSQLIDSIESGKKREVSIGFYSDIDAIEGTFNDSPYSAVQRNILLDHLAVTENGRCSRNHGCGFKSDSVYKVDSIKTVKAIAPVTNVTVGLSKAQTDSLAQADAIIASQRVDMIAQISGARPEVIRDTLDAMSNKELTQTLAILKSGDQIQGFKMDPKNDSVKIIDAAYAKAGKRD